FLPVALADGKDRKPVFSRVIVDKPERALSRARLPAPHVFPVGIDHQEAELLHLHAGGTEGLHEVGLAHAGGRKDAHVLGKHLAVDPDGHVTEHSLPGPHDTNFDVSHHFGEEDKVLCFWDRDRGELGRYRAGLPEDPALINKTERDRFDPDENVLAKAIEMLAERAGIPVLVGKIALVDQIAHFCVEGIPLRPVGDLQDVADKEGFCMGDNKPVREYALADQPEFCRILMFSIVQSHHVNHQRGLQRAGYGFPVLKDRLLYPAVPGSPALHRSARHGGHREAGRDTRGFSRHQHTRRGPAWWLLPSVRQFLSAAPASSASPRAGGAMPRRSPRAVPAGTRCCRGGGDRSLSTTGR